jgi:hypothetical protein
MSDTPHSLPRRALAMTIEAMATQLDRNQPTTRKMAIAQPASHWHGRAGSMEFPCSGWRAGRSVPSMVAPQPGHGPIASVAACRGRNSSLGQSLRDSSSAAAFSAFGRVNPLPGLGLLLDLDKAGATTGGAQFLCRRQSLTHGHKANSPASSRRANNQQRSRTAPVDNPFDRNPGSMPVAGQLFLSRGPHGLILIAVGALGAWQK